MTFKRHLAAAVAAAPLLIGLGWAAPAFAAEAPAPTGSAPAAKPAATAKASVKKHHVKKVKKAAPKEQASAAM